MKNLSQNCESDSGGVTANVQNLLGIILMSKGKTKTALKESDECFEYYWEDISGFSIALVNVSIAAMKQNGPRASWGRMHLFGLGFPSSSLKSGEELKKGRSWCPGTEEHWFAQHDLLSLLSCRIQDYQARDSTTHKGLGPPRSTTSQENCRLAYSPILWRHFLNGCSLLSMTVACVKLTQKKKT